MEQACIIGFQAWNILNTCNQLTYLTAIYCVCSLWRLTFMWKIPEKVRAAQKEIDDKYEENWLTKIHSKWRAITMRNKMKHRREIWNVGVGEV